MRSKGFVLIISVMMLLSISAIAVAFVYLVSVQTRAAAADLNKAKALCLAEAGIQQVIYKALTDTIYRGAPTNINGSVGDGTYAVSVVKQSGKTTYDTTSTGTVGGISRSIAQTAAVTVSGWPKALTAYGAVARSGIRLEDSSKIYGDAYTLGSVTTTTASKVTGTVYASSGTGNYTRLPLPDPLLSIPTLDTTYYTGLINTAKTSPAGDKKYFTLALGSGTTYVNGNVTVTNITGSGTLVSTGTVTMGSGTVDPNVTIISGGALSFPTKSTIGSGGVFYSSTSIYLGDANISINNATLLTPGSVNTISSGKNLGVILCGGDLILDKSVNIGGSVVCGGTLVMHQSSSITQSMNQLPVQVPHGVTSETSVILSSWQES